MSVKGYCTVEDVSDFLGVSLDADTHRQCLHLIEAAEQELDGAMNRAWLTGAIANEEHRGGGRVFVQNYPVATIEAVRVRQRGSLDVTVLDAADYELNGGQGEIRFCGDWTGYVRLWVDYTPVVGVPTDVKQSAIELVASRLQTTLNPSLYGVDSLTLPDYSVRFNRAMVGGAGYPPTVQSVINRYRSWAGA